MQKPSLITTAMILAIILSPTISNAAVRMPFIVRKVEIKTGKDGHKTRIIKIGRCTKAGGFGACTYRVINQVITK